MSFTPRAHLELGLSPAMEDYLKIVYRLSEEHGLVSTQDIAERLQVAPSSVTHMMKRLAQRGLVEHRRYHGVQLTATGLVVAEERIRHHRLLELYLTEALGFPLSEVHAEAERLEHYLSEVLEEKIDVCLGRPTRDPHGSPIPGRSGQRCPQAEVIDLLGLVLLCRSAIVEASSEARELGFLEGLEVVVLGRVPSAKAHVKLAGRELLLSRELCSEVLVKPFS